MRKLKGLGQILGAVPEIREIVAEARDSLAAGVPDQEVRAQAVRRGRTLGIIGPSVIIPSLSRKLLRMELRVFLHRLADELATKAQGKRVGDIAEDLYSRLDVDSWFADYVVSWAAEPDGEPGTFLPQVSGHVWTQKLGFGEERMQTVWMLITPFSDPHELLHQAYEECHKVLPEGVWSRYGRNEEAHRLLRLKATNPDHSWGDIAERLLDEKEPHLREMGSDVFAERREQERERIEKLMKRFFKEYADSFFDGLSADSD